MTATAPSPRQLRAGGRSPGAGGATGKNSGGVRGAAKQQQRQRPRGVKDSLSLTLPPSSLASPRKAAAAVPSTDWLSDLKSAFGVSTSASTANGASKDVKKKVDGGDGAAAAAVEEEEEAGGSGALEQVMSYVKVRFLLLLCSPPIG